MTQAVFSNDFAGQSNTGGFFAKLSKRWADHRLYARTVAELNDLNDHELRDLGLSRFSIKQVALESVYSKDDADTSRI